MKNKALIMIMLLVAIMLADISKSLAILANKTESEVEDGKID